MIQCYCNVYKLIIFFKIHLNFLFSNYFIIIFLFIVSFYIYYYTTISLLKLIKKTIKFKFIIFTLYCIFNLLGIGDYFFFISYIIYASIFYGFLVSKNKFNFMLNLVFLILFWNSIDIILELIDFNCLFDIFCLFIALALIDLDKELESSKCYNTKIPVNYMISPDKFTPKILELKESIKESILNSKGKGPQNLKIFFEWLSLSDDISKVKKEILSSIIEKNNSNSTEGLASETELSNKKPFKSEFYDHIPSFSKDWIEKLPQIIIIGKNIYVSNPEAFGLEKITTNFISINNHNEVNNSNVAEEDRLYLLTSKSEFLNFIKSKSHLGDFENKKIIPKNNKTYLKESKYFKKNWFFWIIELNVHFFLINYLNKLEPIEDMTISKFMISNYVANYEYYQEYEFLLKAEKGLNQFCKLNSLTLGNFLQAEENDNGSNDPNYDSEEINFFIKFWIRQIVFFNQLNLNESEKGTGFGRGVLINMYNISNIQEELLENILFVQTKILETTWTINKVNNSISTVNLDKSPSSKVKILDISKLKNQDENNISAIKIKFQKLLGYFKFNPKSETLVICSSEVSSPNVNKGDERIYLKNYFNELFDLFRKEVYKPHEKVYELRREFIEDRYNNQPLSWYLHYNKFLKNTYGDKLKKNLKLTDKNFKSKPKQIEYKKK